MKKIFLPFILFLFTALHLSAQPNSLNVLQSPSLPGTNTITLQVSAVGFTFPNPIQGSFNVVIGTSSQAVQFVNSISSTQVLISFTPNCVSAGQMGSVMYFNSNPTPMSAMGSFTNQLSSISLQWTNQSYYCYASNDGSATVAVKSGGTAPYTFIYKNDTTKNVALNQTLTLQGVGPVTTMVVKDNAGCTMTNIQVPTYGAITLTVQGSSTAPSDETCNGSGIRYIHANVGGTIQYQWYDANDVLIPDQISSTITDQCAGKYFVVATMPAFGSTPACSTKSFVDIPGSVVTNITNGQIANNNVYMANDALMIPVVSMSMTVTIYDLNGVEQDSQTLNNTSPSSLGKVSLSELKPGLYIYKITSPDVSLSGRFVR